MWKVLTNIGGGKELVTCLIISLIWAPRSKFMYYLFVLAIDKVIVSYFKLFYNHPRPYMIDGNIKPISCSKSFGNPSGHSCSASLFAIVVFCDVFHGSQMGQKPSKFYSWYTYISVLLFMLFWAGSIPYTRFVMGVHSLDQIIYGSCLGVWSGFIMHFLVRDNIISHV